MTVIESGSHTQTFSIVMWKWSILVPITFMDTINQSGPDIPEFQWWIKLQCTFECIVSGKDSTLKLM